LSAIARRFAAIVAVLVMAGAFVSGAVAGSAPTATAVATNFPVHAEVVPSDPFFGTNGAFNRLELRPRGT